MCLVFTRLSIARRTRSGGAGHGEDSPAGPLVFNEDATGKFYSGYAIGAVAPKYNDVAVWSRLLERQGGRHAVQRRQVADHAEPLTGASGATRQDGAAGNGSAVLYRTCLSAKLERIFSMPGIGVSCSMMNFSSAAMSATAMRIR